MILRDRCSTSYVWPGITFSWDAQYFRQVDWKNRKTQWYEAVRKSRRIASFLMLSTLKNKDVSQDCFVFDLVKFEN